MSNPPSHAGKLRLRGKRVTCPKYTACQTWNVGLNLGRFEPKPIALNYG